jgi:hypothetical protein
LLDQPQHEVLNDAGKQDPMTGHTERPSGLTPIDAHGGEAR